MTCALRLLLLLSAWQPLDIVLAMHSRCDTVWLAAFSQSITQQLTHCAALCQQVQNLKRLLGMLWLAE